MTEFCPARVTVFAPSAGDPDLPAASKYTYELTALSLRSVDATIIADTDKGWFGWRVAGVPVGAVSYTRTPAGGTARTDTRFESVDLTAVFPEPVVVRHAWVTSASTTGELILGWNHLGTVPCPYVEARPSVAQPAGMTVRRISPATPAVTVADAVPAEAPFEPQTCAVPFSNAAVKMTVQPNYPDSAKGLTAPVRVLVVVAIGVDGKVVDAWIGDGSGHPGIDDAALRAAQRSTYTPAIAYCRPIKGTYAFAAVFDPTPSPAP
jgi:TonB family protein